ncbi:MAG TPA: hypothetical protein ENJ79_10020 [Gammaproteobacteria bacterium]|nr:hypothetical protein [Gammaproteobacteria bacterium]
MADLFSVTAPLAIRLPDGRKEVIAEKLPYDDGLLYLPPFWMNMEPLEALRYVPGPIRGEGPWKVGDAVVAVLACHGTDATLAGAFSDWQACLMQLDAAYPDMQEIERFMRVHAARAAGIDHCNPRFSRQNQE